MSAFALAYAHPRQQVPATPFAYDPDRQLNVLADGTPAATSAPVLIATGSTASTAGSKTSWDD